MEMINKTINRYYSCVSCTAYIQ